MGCAAPKAETYFSVRYPALMSKWSDERNSAEVNTQEAEAWQNHDLLPCSQVAQMGGINEAHLQYGMSATVLLFIVLVFLLGHMFWKDEA